ncbi:hypothetical protein T4B_9084 [Trichinella pseudospiralis]|uniref:Uncharacterized protein n=1 Tax=Trichinella pseudospiralis TaxID=6337 RepID=A0A0V1JYE8_TRIPS|nr:hypothetical protein T4A_3117 [Trichinella pseudospiralis]KRZ22396.1 hypothetical protein T4B_9084 [Trichinella pseudospiralis]KRZ39942.1 hypothetical protein T4C_6600 [Trichinella pseudospiralis]
MNFPSASTLRVAMFQLQEYLLISHCYVKLNQTFIFFCFLSFCYIIPQLCEIVHFFSTVVEPKIGLSVCAFYLKTLLSKVCKNGHKVVAH